MMTTQMAIGQICSKINHNVMTLPLGILSPSEIRERSIKVGMIKNFPSHFQVGRVVQSRVMLRYLTEYELVDDERKETIKNKISSKIRKNYIGRKDDAIWANGQQAGLIPLTLGPKPEMGHYHKLIRGLLFDHYMGDSEAKAKFLDLYNNPPTSFEVEGEKEAEEKKITYRYVEGYTPQVVPLYGRVGIVDYDKVRKDKQIRNLCTYEKDDLIEYALQQIGIVCPESYSKSKIASFIYERTIVAGGG